MKMAPFLESFSGEFEHFFLSPAQFSSKWLANLIKLAYHSDDNCAGNKISVVTLLNVILHKSFWEKIQKLTLYDSIVKSCIWACFIAYFFPSPRKIFRLFYETFYMLHLESKLTPEAKLHLLRRNTIWRRRKNRPNKTRSRA